MKKTWKKVLTCTVTISLAVIPALYVFGAERGTVESNDSVATEESGVIGVAVQEKETEMAQSDYQAENQENKDYLPDEGFKDTGSSIESRKAASAKSAAETGSDESDIHWAFEDGILIISGSGEIPAYDSTNPYEWAVYKDEITSLTIESGITAIGKAAFYQYTKLETVILPDTLQTIGVAAFAECYALKSISGAEGVQSIKEYAFQRTGLSSFEITASMDDIHAMAFYDCASLEEFTGGNQSYKVQDGAVYTEGGRTLYMAPAGMSNGFIIPSNVTTIGENAFIKNCWLTSVKIPDSVTKLGDSAFAYCSSLESIELPDSVSEVGYSAFYGCGKLRSVKFGNGLASTSSYMFESCTMLETIDFGGLKELAGRSFSQCDSLTELTVPQTIMEVGYGCFANCTSLETVHYEPSADYVPADCFLNCANLKDVTIGEGIKIIYGRAFLAKSSNLKSVALPASIVHSYDMAFPEETEIIKPNTNLISYGTNGVLLADQLSVSGEADYQKAFEVLDLVNQARAENGLTKLHMDEELMETAMRRATETVVLFSHSRPDSRDCFTASSKMRAENIASGQATASAVMNSWMNSSGHRANILDPDLCSIGIGCIKNNGVTYWAQCFGDEELTEDCSSPENSVRTYIVNVLGDDFTNSEGNTVSYELFVKADSNPIMVGESTKATLYSRNPGFSSWLGKLDTTGLNLQTENEKVAKVDSEGQITGLAPGETSLLLMMPVHGTVSTNIKVNAHSIEEAEITGLSELSYTGQPLTPAPIVKIGETVLVEGTDYTLSYENNTDAGTAKVIITGIGKYTGTIEKTFTINKVDQKLTVSISKTEIGEGNTAVITVDGIGGISYSSSNPDVAEVDEKGIVTGKKKGTVTIKINAAGDTNHNEASQSIELSVDHVWETEMRVDKQPSCTDEGSESIHCSVCGEIKEGSERAIAKTDHSWESDYRVDKEPTCTEEGLKSIHCTYCDEVKDETVIPAAGHSFGDWETNGEEDHKHICSVCGTKETEAHVWGEPEITKEATEDEEGLRTYTCSVCGQTKTEVIPKTDHVHHYTDTVVDPTCTEQGYTIHKCEKCGDEYTDTFTEALGHAFGEWVVVTEATCTESGSKERICERCGEKETEVILAIGHTETEDPAVDPNCTEPGKTAGSHCAVCGEVIRAQEEIAALGHDWDEGMVTKEATFEEEGEMTYTCLRCGEKRTEVIQKLDIVSVTGVTVEPSNEEMPTSQTIKEKPYTITEASTLQLKVRIEPENATNQKVTWSSSNDDVATVNENGLVTAYTYGKVTITATTDDGKKTASCEIQTRYNDVEEPGYWFNPVYWVADNNITKGYANIYFGPEENCTREQMITFLYRTAGSPAVSASDIKKYNTFSDVPGSAYYTKAVVWAAMNGITKGYSSGPNKGKFGVGLNVTREDTVTFIYRMAGKPKYSTTKSFSDVMKGKYYYDPVLWAAQNGITNGYSSGPNKGKFGVGFNVLRKDIVTFLYRYANLK